jgi:calcium-dependent protein kinase
LTGTDGHEIMRKVKNGPDPTYQTKDFQHITKDAIDFIKKCLGRNVETRLSATDVQQHPWFQQLRDNAPPPSPMKPQIITSLKQFSNRSRLSRVCLEVISHLLNSEQIDDLRKEFSKVDKNGEIDFTEVSSI